jgi:hypothetical protein
VGVQLAIDCGVEAEALSLPRNADRVRNITRLRRSRRYLLDAVVLLFLCAWRSLTRFIIVCSRGVTLFPGGGAPV